MSTETPLPSLDPSPPEPPVIATPRLVLRARLPGDADALFPAMSDPAIMLWWSRAPYDSLDELRENFGPRASIGWRAWAITRAGDYRAIGFVAASEKRQGGVSEIGYLLAPEAQGQGIAQEAVAGVVARLFAEGQRRVFADTDPDNRGSIALLERLGFRLEGRLRGEWLTHLGVRDSLIFGLLADDWREPATS